MKTKILTHRGAALVRLVMLCLFAALCVAVFMYARPAFASGSGAMLNANSSKEEKTADVPDEVFSALEGLISMTTTPGVLYDQTRTVPLFEYIGATAGDGDTVMPKRDGARGVCVRETIGTPLSRILQYGYNPDIPPYVVLPSVVRHSNWYPESDLMQERPHLWDALNTLEAPIVLNGREFEEITPDSFSGAYYSYDLSRVLILTRYEGRGVLISISRQDGPSSVGKKGGILDDATWDYIYSDEEGLTSGGIGWMDTYMYGSSSVSIYMEDAQGLTTSSVVFKWLKAGWAGLNVVRPKHIISGCRRFTGAFRKVIESEQLPSPAAISAKLQQFMAMTNEQLEELVGRYTSRLAERWKDHPLMENKVFSRLFEDGRYASELSREERISLLMKNYLRGALGVSMS